MRRAVRFLVFLIAGLGLLTWAAMAAVNATTRAWFEKDLALRSHLAVSGSRRTLVAHWRAGQWKQLGELLADITHDERIMGASACSPALRTLVATLDFPSEVACERLQEQAGAQGQGPGQKDDLRRELEDEWSLVVPLPGGKARVSAIPVSDAQGTVGYAVLVHDLGFVERREGTTRLFLLLAFAVLAGAASVLTIVAGRLSWRSWSNELRRLIKGGGLQPEYQPLLTDLRELVDRLVLERDVEAEGGVWTAERLKRTLTKQLEGERVVIVANREPYIHARMPDGRIVVQHPASGLVTALEPVMRACSGVWVAHGSGSADRETADRDGRIRVPPTEESYVVRRVWLSREEEQGYYYGFSNEGLWPLCHIAHIRPTFRNEDWLHYQRVNQRFADAVCAEAHGDDPIILVQDYHFALAPRLIRARLPRATIISFWHIPWPNAERFGICPWKDELLEGLLGSSVVGFHTQLHCNNFTEAVDRNLEARIDREETSVLHQGHRTLVRSYPISIEWPSRWGELAPPPQECRRQVLQELGLPSGTLLGVGVDRLDYTKGIEERLLAVERLLEREPALHGRFVFVQLAAPSRTEIERYRELSVRVEQLAARINQRFGRGPHLPIILLRAHHEPAEVFRYYRAADVCYVSSLHDGMNLVAKEFVAARDDERGVLVLSHFAGAARELPEALIVNPYDIEQASAALGMALAMSPDEQRDRMRAMRSLISEFNVYRWAGRMLRDAARLRQRERLRGRLTTATASVATARGGWERAS
jgi:trehalose 6-phosphate synthase